MCNLWGYQSILPNCEGMCRTTHLSWFADKRLVEEFDDPSLVFVRIEAEGTGVGGGGGDPQGGSLAEGAGEEAG